MDFFEREIININSVSIFLLHYKEFNPDLFLDVLTNIERERFFSFSSLTRKQEFCASRILRHELFGDKEIQYLDHGAPYIRNEGFISISHTKNCIGIAICKNHQIGLDMEPIRGKALMLRDKFLSDKERTFLDLNSELEMTKLWSGKEAQYKLAGRKKIIFKEQLLFDRRENDTWYGRIINPEEIIHVEFAIFEHRDMIMSINPIAPRYEKID